MCPAEPHFLPKNCLFFSPKWPLSQKSPVNRDIYVCFSYTASLSDSSEAMISWQRKCLDRKWFCRALTIQKNVHEQSFFCFFFNYQGCVLSAFTLKRHNLSPAHWDVLITMRCTPDLTKEKKAKNNKKQQLIESLFVLLFPSMKIFTNGCDSHWQMSKPISE